MSTASQTTKATRLQLVNSRGSALLPWVVLAMVFVVNLALFAVADTALTGSDEFMFTGALSSFYIVALIANLQTWTQTFPFALGLSLTRGAFIRGTALVILGQSLLAGLGLTALKAVEVATGGWGVNMDFFGLAFVSRDNVGAQLLAYAVPFLALSTLGSVLGVVFKRWGQRGMWLVMIATILGLGGLAVLVTWRGWWGAIGEFFTSTQPLLLLAGYPALVALVLAAIAFLAVRRATP